MQRYSSFGVDFILPVTGVFLIEQGLDKCHCDPQLELDWVFNRSPVWATVDASDPV